MNHFCETYGENINYSKIEQESYIDFKNMAFENIGRKIKIRKFSREGMMLTIKLEVTSNEYRKILDMAKDLGINNKKKNYEKKFKFVHDYAIYDVKIENKNLIKK